MDRASKILGTVFVAALLASFLIPLFYRIEPGTMEQKQPHQISGNFHVLRSAWLGFFSEPPYVRVVGYRSRLGGACIVARPAHLNITYPAGAPVTPEGAGCTTNDQCSAGGYQGYCEPVSKQCWVRPGGGAFGSAEARAVCNRSADHGNVPWGVGQHPATLENFQTDNLDSSRTVDWRVVGCHVVDGRCDNSYGEVSTIRR